MAFTWVLVGGRTGCVNVPVWTSKSRQPLSPNQLAFSFSTTLEQRQISCLHLDLFGLDATTNEHIEPAKATTSLRHSFVLWKATGDHSETEATGTRQGLDITVTLVFPTKPRSGRTSTQKESFPAPRSSAGPTLPLILGLRKSTCKVHALGRC